MYIHAYVVSDEDNFELVPLSVHRKWMRDTDEKFAERCLPMLLANQAGWAIKTRRPVSFKWNGSKDPASIHFIPEKNDQSGVVSHFGYGIITWRLPYLFRTSDGYNLLVRGPSNMPKHGVTPLEGIVETDWSTSTFTMNWKVTAIDEVVTFDIDDIICVIVPQRRGELESFQCEIKSISDNVELEIGYKEWSRSRSQFMLDIQNGEIDAVKQGWQRHYFKGTDMAGQVFGKHQTRFRLNYFKRM